jgi:hypothetical protein
MGHHWREKREDPGHKPSVLWELIGLILGAFRPGDSSEYLSFDPKPRAFKDEKKVANSE